MNQKKDLLNEHRKMQMDALSQKKKELKQKVLEDLHETVKGFTALLPDNNPEAWRAVLYYLKRFRRVLKGIQSEIQNPDLDENTRRFLIGKAKGLEQMIDFPRIVLQYKRTLEDERKTEDLTEFLVSQHITRNQGRG